MPSPAIIPCPAHTWTLVAIGAKGGRINRGLTNPTKYIWTYRVTGSGDSAPTSATDGVPIFDDRTYLKLPPSKGIDVYIYPYEKDGSVRADILTEEIENVPQDNTSPWNDFYFVQAIGPPTTLTVAVPDPSLTPSRILSVASIVNISIGDWLGVFSGVSGTERYYWAEVLDINGLDLTMQTLMDYPFPIGAVVLSTTKNMAVDGSVTEQVFGIQAGGLTGILEIDISRVMMASLTDNANNLSTFADIVGGLDRGMYLRVKENGVFRNKMIAKTNYDLAKFAFDWTAFQSINPQQGQDGFKWRFSLNGSDKHGAVSRVSGGNIGTLQWVIQDDQTGIFLLESVGANSEVTP